MPLGKAIRKIMSKSSLTRSSSSVSSSSASSPSSPPPSALKKSLTDKSLLISSTSDRNLKAMVTKKVRIECDLDSITMITDSDLKKGSCNDLKKNAKNKSNESKSCSNKDKSFLNNENELNNKLVKSSSDEDEISDEEKTDQIKEDDACSSCSCSCEDESSDGEEEVGLRVFYASLEISR
ncbi:hypothetical protein ElyMa_001716900 [Elysia marginata]|uniref:Uncharacterized protein n=1 Tax=Elysia marginata TaxID=1093978 RepID=A0AAV4JUN1_9GAST|nr:hypothetical protein ElyMa_001716900 [Elysia marginata]